MTDFEGIFLLRALEEDALGDTIKAGQLLQQTRLLEAHLGLLQEILTVLNQLSLREIVGIQADAIIAQNVVSGEQIIHQLPAGGPGTSFPAHWERHYLQALITRCDRLDLTPLAASEATTETLSISQVVTTLYLANATRGEDEAVAEGYCAGRQLGG